MGNSIPLPSFDIDRDSFGHWLSGFADGEACFQIWTARVGRWSRGGASFTIALRADDAAILETIQSFLQCGVIHRQKARKVISHSGKEAVINPQHFYRVDSLTDLHSIVTAHFDRYPLRAKKSRDFAIWKSGVEILLRILRRKRRALGKGRGTLPKWTPAEWAEFEALVASLKEQRCYLAPVLRD